MEAADQGRTQSRVGPNRRLSRGRIRTYAGKLAAMIRDKASDEELVRYLEWAEAEHMGFGRFDTERGRKVVQSLRDLGPAPDTHNLS